MFTNTFELNSGVGGVNIVGAKISRSGEDQVGKDIAVPAGKAGTVTSGTDTRLLTLGSGHGITDAMKVGVFWSTGQRLGMTVTAYDATTISVTASSGVGDAFPANATAIVVGAEKLESAIAFLATNMEMFVVSADQVCGMLFQDASHASLLHVSMAANAFYNWSSGVGPANPITGTVAEVGCYNGSITAIEHLKIGVQIA